MIVDCPNWSADRLVKPLVDKSDNIDIVYHYVEGKPKNTGFNKTPCRHITINEFDKNYDVFHFHCLRAGIVCLQNKEILKKIGNREIVFTIHTERDLDLKELLDSNIKIDKVICPTKYDFDRLKGKFKTYLVPHCIEIEKFPYLEKLEGSEVGYIGRIVSWKRYKELVEACRGKYKVNGIGYVADGDYWKNIDNSGNEFNINVQQENMNNHIKKHFKIFTCLSVPNVEAGPLPTLECMALGIPVLTTNIGWAKDNLGPEDVFFTDGNFKKDIETLMENDIMRESLRKNARKIIEKFNMDWYLKQHKEIYES